MKNKNFTKIISLALAVFLLITASINDFAYAISVTPAMQSVVANTDSLKNFNINNNVISYNLGKVTSAINCNSDTVVVNIQDFHCNPSVQKNISDIISSLVKKYNINSIYVEGGYGNINTKWLSDIKDENIKTQLIKVLLENGSLTGAEYFSATNPSSNINIYGIEKESVYKENFERLQNIFSNKNKYEQIIKTFEKDLTFLQNKYFDTGNRKFNNVLKKYRNGQIETRKFYKILLRYVQKYNNSTNSVYGTLLPIRIKDYPNIYTYMMLGEYEKNIKFTKITVEIKEILAILKTTLSYEQYSQIIKNSNNLKDIPKLVSILNTLPEDFRNNNFSSEMKNFINYVEISKQINPVKLVEEERLLIENLRLALSKNEAELAISFLSDFFSYFTDYLKTSITADNYKYFLSKFDKFKTVWDKYTYYNQINKYKKEFDILDAYYKTNVQRDYLFLENIEKIDILKSGTNGKQDNNYATILEKAKNIILIVTGGFHSEGLANVLTKNNISYMVITPNVKGNVDFANTRYAQLLQAPLTDISKQAFQLPLLSNGERLEIVYEGLKGLDIKPTQENVEFLNKTANEIISNLTGRKTRYNNIFKTDEGLITVNEGKFFEIQNVLKNALKENIDFINPKNYADNTFSFMKKFAYDSNGMIWEISQLSPDIIEQLRNIGYSEYLPEFLQQAYYKIGTKISRANTDNIQNIKEYELAAHKLPVMIKFPSGKIILISREMDDGNEKYYIIDENFNWNTETNKKQERDNNPRKTLVENLKEQDYAKDNNGNSVIWLSEKKDSNSVFIAANSDVEFIDLTEINIDIPIYDNDSSYAQTQMDKDLISVLNETNNKYSQNINMINASEIEENDIAKLDDNQVVFVCLQDFIDAQSKKKKRIEEYVKYAIKNNKPIIIYPNLYAGNAELSNADIRFLFSIVGDRFVDFSNFYVSIVSSYIIESVDFNGINEYNQNSFRKYVEELLKYSLKEILKNTFVHGNLSELNKPIVINFDKNNPQIDVLNLNSNKKENIYRKLITFITDLRGFGRGLSEIKEGFSKLYDKYSNILKDNKWQYSDNFKDENRKISYASLKLNNKEIKENNDNPNIIYRGKADKPFILKKYENELFFIKNSHNFQITVKNNKIQYDEPKYFYPWAYGLEVKKDKDDIIIEKVTDSPENIKIFPLTEFSPINFSTDVLDKLSKKYFVDEEKVENIESNNYETIYLEDFIRTDVNKIMDMWTKIDKNIKDGKPIKIFPLRNYNNKKVVSEISEQDYDKFVQLYIMLNSVISRFCDNYRDKILDNKEFSNLDDKTKTALKKELRYDLVEILKNAIVHGNNLDLSKPVTLEFDKDNFQINILNNYSQEETDFTLQCLSAFSGLSGFGLGIKNMSGEDKLFKYFDNFDEERIESRASLKLKDKGNYLKIDKTKLKNTDYYREISERILEIFERNNIDVNENSKALNFIIPLILNNENITQKDLEKLNGTKTEITELILKSIDAKLKDNNTNRNVLNRLKEIEFVLEIEEQSKTTSYVSFKVFESLGDEFWDPNEYKLLVNTKDDTIYGESKNISYDEFKKLNKNYKVKNIHVLDYANIKTRDITELFFEKSTEGLQNKINTSDINKLGLTKEVIKTVSLNEYPNSPNKIIQNTTDYLIDGNVVALFPPLHNWNLQNINSFEELKYMFDVVRTVLWDFCEDLNKEFISQGIIKDSEYTDFFGLDVVLNESLKNAFVHGGHLKTNQPIYLYVKDNRFYVSNIIDKENTATEKQKSAATMAGLCGFHRGINTLKQSASLDYINKEENSLYTVSFKPNLNTNNIVYKGAYNDFFVIDVPGKEPVFIRFHRGSFNTANYIIEVKGSKVNKNLEKMNFEQYGLKLETSSDGKEITIVKDKNYKEGTNIIGIPARYDDLNKKNNLSSKEIEKQNESNKKFFDDLDINISNEKKYEIIHLQDDNSSDLKRKIKNAVNSGKPLIIYPYLYNDFKVALQDKDYAKLYFLFKELGNNIHLLEFTNTYADIVTNDFFDEFNSNLKTSMKEVLKNSIVHGNNMDLSLPVVIKFDKDNFKIDVFNQNIKDNPNKILQTIVAAADWTGFGEGIKRMQSFNTLQYFDNNNNGQRNPDDKIWQTTLIKKKDTLKEIKNKMISKIDVDDEIAEYFINNVITNEKDLLNDLEQGKSAILKKLLSELEKAAYNLQRLPSQTDILKNIYVIVEKNDGTVTALTLTGNRLSIVAQNGDFVNFKYLDGQTETDLINNVENIHIAYIDDEGYDYYKEEANKLKKYDAKTAKKNYPTTEILSKMGFTTKDVVPFEFNEFINDKDSFKEKLFTDLQNGKLITIFPYYAQEISAENTIFKNKYINNEFLREIAFYLATKIRENSDEYFSADYGYDILEILKNTFVHGNNLSSDKPIFMYVKGGRFYITNIVDKENAASNYQKTLAVLSNLTGVHEGNNFIRSNVQLEYKYSDINKLQTGDAYEASIKVGNINNNIVYSADYDKIEDTVFMIELPDNDNYKLKYVYIQPRKGKLLIRVVDNEDKLSAGDYSEVCLEDLSKDDLKRYGIENFEYTGTQFKITHKKDVKIIKLLEKRNIKLQFDDKIQKTLMKNANDKNKKFLENSNIDISKEIVDISNERLNQVKDIEQKNVVLNLQDFNRNDKEQLYKIEKNIEYCLQKDIPIIIYPYLNENPENLDYVSLKLLFKVAGIKLVTFCNFYSEIVSQNWDANYDDFKFSFFETLKNAIIHGNNADLSLPIVIKSKKEESKIEIINDNIPNKDATDNKKINLLGKFFAAVEEWHGQGLGIKSMLDKDTLTYCDNNITKTTNNDLWTASIILKGKYKNQQESIDNDIENAENESFEKEYDQFFSNMVKTVAGNVIKNNCETYLEKDINKLPFDKENISVFGLDSLYLDNLDTKDNKEFVNNIFENLQAGKTIALYPPFLFLKMKTNYGENYANISSENLKFLYSNTNELFNIFSKELSEYIKNTYGKDIRKKEVSMAVYEILKNAFVHGNNLSFNKPIYIYVKDGKLCITNIVDKGNTASNNELTAAVEAGLTDINSGNDVISKLKSVEYNYANINELNTGDMYETSIKIENNSNQSKSDTLPNFYESIMNIPSSLINMCISMFGNSFATNYCINYEFVSDINNVLNKNKDDVDTPILNVKIINKNIDNDINSKNIKLVNSGLKVNGEIVWTNKNNNELLVYCKEQNYEEILSVAKSIVLKTINTNNITEFCVDKRYNAQEITEIAGITAINSFVYNDLKENKISVASAIKDVNIMEQKTSSLYSVSKGNQIFLEYEIKDDVSYNNFVNKVLAENLGFGYVIDIETVNKYGKDFEMILEQAKEEKNINVYIKGKDNQINFKRIENFNDIKTLEEKITETNFSENIPLIPAVKLFSLVDKERFTDKLAMLNKLAKLLFVKKEYNDDYVKDLANNADKKLLKEISNYGIEKILKDLKENNFDDILNTISQSPVVKITFKKIEQNVSDTVKAEQLKTEFVKTIAVRTILYNLSGNKMLNDKYRRNLKDIEELLIQTFKDEKQFNRINVKDNELSFNNDAVEIIEEIKQRYGSSYSDIISLKNYDAITKLEYILNYFVDDRTKINKEENEFNTTMAMKALLSAA